MKNADTNTPSTLNGCEACEVAMSRSCHMLPGLITNAKVAIHEIGLHSIAIQHIRVRNEKVQQVVTIALTRPC
jgi:hypothetical protein